MFGLLRNCAGRKRKLGDGEFGVFCVGHGVWSEMLNS